MAIIKDYKSGEPKISNITKMHVRFSPLLDNFAWNLLKTFQLLHPLPRGLTHVDCLRVVSMLSARIEMVSHPVDVGKTTLETLTSHVDLNAQWMKIVRLLKHVKTSTVLTHVLKLAVVAMPSVESSITSQHAPVQRDIKGSRSHHVNSGLSVRTWHVFFPSFDFVKFSNWSNSGGGSLWSKPVWPKLSPASSVRDEMRLLVSAGHDRLPPQLSAWVCPQLWLRPPAGLHL